MPKTPAPDFIPEIEAEAADFLPEDFDAPIRPRDSLNSGPFKFTRSEDESEYDLKTPSRPPAPWYSLRDTNLEKVGSEPGIAGENVYESPRWAGAMAATLLTGGAGILPLAARAALGGIGGKAVEQTVDAARGAETAPESAGEALLQQAGAGVETGAAELLGGLGGKALGAMLPRAPRQVFPEPQLSAGFPSRRAPTPSITEAIVNKIRTKAHLQPAVAQLQKLDEPHPLGKLEPHERGGIVGASEEQVFKLRKQHGNELYKPLDNFSGVSIRELVDPDTGSLRVPSGVEIPAEIKSALTRVKNAQKGLAAAQAQLASKQAKVRPGEVVGNDALEGSIAEAQAELDAAQGALDDVSFSAAHELRKSMSAALRKIDPRGPEAQKIPSFVEPRNLLTLEMEDAANKLSPDDYAAWRRAEDFWGQEIAENHYRGVGEAIGRKFEAGDPQKMGKVLEAFAPQDVTAAHKTLVPGSWAPESARVSGQRAFDQLVEQRIATNFGARNASDTIDLSRAGKIIDKRIGTATWAEMKRLVSPKQRARMESLETVARTYERIGAATEMNPLEEAALQQAKGQFSRSWLNPIGAYRNFRELKPHVLKWALEHPARVELLTRDLDTAVGTQAQEIAERNLGTVVRLYNMDRNRPPEPPAALRKVLGL